MNYDRADLHLVKFGATGGKSRGLVSEVSDGPNAKTSPRRVFGVTNVPIIRISTSGAFKHNYNYYMPQGNILLAPPPPIIMRN